MRHSKDYAQVIKSVYDPESNALKTTPSEATSFAIELDANDGDSAEVRGMQNRTNPSLGEAVDISKMRRVSVWIEGGTANYTLTAKVGNASMTLGTVTSGQGVVHEVLADTLEVTGLPGATITVIGSGL